MHTNEAHVIYAGFWRRVVAALIDVLLFLLIALPIGLALGVGALRDAPGSWAGFMLNYALPAVLTIVLWRRYLGTPGKLVMRSRIVDAASYRPATTRQLIIRYLAYVVSALPLCAGYLWIAFDARKRGFHDMLANTVVIVTPPGEPLPAFS